jgi:hypothetical protein
MLDEYVECPICQEYIYFENWDHHYKNHLRLDDDHRIKCFKCQKNRGNENES